MEVPKPRSDQNHKRIQRLEFDDPNKNHYQYVKSKVWQMAGKIIDEIQQELDPETSSQGFYENWITIDWDQLARLKIELDKLINFSHGAYPDKKKTLNHRMLHEVRDMDAERCLLKMFNSKEHKESGFPLKKLEEQDQLRRSDRDSVFSKTEIQKQIQVLEKKREEVRKMILDRRKKLESMKREITRARPCSLMVWGICSHPKIHEFDPFLWGLCGCTCQKPLSKKNKETTIATMTIKSLREKLESIRGQRERAFVNLLFQINDLEHLKAAENG